MISDCPLFRIAPLPMNHKREATDPHVIKAIVPNWRSEIRQLPVLGLITTIGNAGIPHGYPEIVFLTRARWFRKRCSCELSHSRA